MDGIHFPHSRLDNSLSNHMPQLVHQFVCQSSMGAKLQSDNKITLTTTAR